MHPRPATPRIAPLPPEEQVGQYAELLDGLDANIFTTFARAPGLFRRWLPFGGKLLGGKLPARDRELLILRTSVNCDAVYEWGQHVPIALQAGLSREEIDRVASTSLDGWAPFDATLLRAADELHSDDCLGDATWALLAERYDTQQLIELPMLVGHYHLVAMTLNSLGVQVDPGLTGFPS
jgi:4-carboxymuconolactone decarboxylase